MAFEDEKENEMLSSCCLKMKSTMNIEFGSFGSFGERKEERKKERKRIHHLRKSVAFMGRPW